MMTPNMTCFTTDMRLRDDGGGVLPTAPWRLKALEGKTLRNIDGLVQERRNSSTLAMKLHLSCTNPSICYICMVCIYFAKQDLYSLGRKLSYHIDKISQSLKATRLDVDMIDWLYHYEIWQVPSDMTVKKFKIIVQFLVSNIYLVA